LMIGRPYGIPNRRALHDEFLYTHRMGRSSKPLSDSNSNLSFSFSFGMKKVLAIVVLAILLSVVLSSLITYVLTRQPRTFNPETDREDSIPDVSDTSGPSAEALRLPSSLYPENYRLQVKVYLPGYGAKIDKAHNLTADVDLTIRMGVVQSTSEIVLNSKELIYTDQSFSVERKVKSGELSALSFTGFKVEKELEKVTINTDRLNVGDTIYLKIKYSARILDILGGLYVNTYKDAAGNTKLLAMTQMEPTDARRMVPCFDEPSYKATWDVTVEHPEGTVALSNGLETGTIPTSAGWQLTTFKQTPKMSSYLLAIVVGDISKTEKTNENGVLVRVWARHETVADTAYALEAGAKVLAKYDEYFGIKFPLEKMDMVACPDFSAGAMENWGLVTYRETDLLYNAETYGMNEKQRVATVVAHELAHQWFGNLVTMGWWDDLWLNEGFATLVEYDGTDIISDKNYHMEEDFVRDAQDTAFNHDALPTSQPCSFKIDKAIEVAEAFNAISYDKGGSVLRMIRSVLGPAVFQEGLKVYLEKHKYGNAAAADLWAALQVAADNHKIQGPRNAPLNLHHFASQWTTQMGFPVVIAKRLNSSFVEFSQMRYKSTSATQERLKYRNPEFGFKWDIPLTLTRGEGDIVEKFWVDRDHPLVLPLPANEFFVMNIDSFGFYRTHYEDGGWKRIGKALEENHKRFSTRTRARLISDAFAMAQIGKLSYGDLFDMVKEYIKKEDDTLPLNIFNNEYNVIVSYLASEPTGVDLNTFKRGLLRPQYDVVDKAQLVSFFSDDTLFWTNVKTNTVIKEMCSAKDPGCVADEFKDYQDNFLTLCNGTGLMSSECSKVAAPLRMRTYCDGVKYSTPGAYEVVQDLLIKEKNQMEGRALLKALTCTTDIAQLKRQIRGSYRSQLFPFRTLLVSLDPKQSLVRSQDLGTLFSYVSANQLARPFLFDFLFEQWDKIYERLKEDNSILSSVVKGCVNMKSMQQIHQLVTWRNAHAETKSMHAFSEKIATAYKLIDWNRDYGQQVSDYFSKQK
ncbi:hypothetical protein PFISCL1PPCAC_2266, partial [Pristionchus fissidentatus]